MVIEKEAVEKKKETLIIFWALKGAHLNTTTYGIFRYANYFLFTFVVEGK